MTQFLSTMLIEVLADEFEAQTQLNPAQIALAMDASSFYSSSMCHDFS
jgi:hypothetical protein